MAVIARSACPCRDAMRFDTVRRTVFMTFKFARFARRTTLAIVLGLGTASSIAADKPKNADPLPAQELTPRTLYELLLAGIAGARGQISLSTQLYLDLARNTRDPRIARRATEVAMFARQFRAAMEAARSWSAADPDSAEAKRVVAGLLVSGGTNRLD